MLSCGLVGYKNHARRMLDLLLEIEDVADIFVYYPSRDVLESSDILGISSRVSITNIFDDLLVLDFIVIASPTSTHISYIEKLSLYQGYIFCEKPAVQLAEYNHLVSFSKNSRLYFNYNYRRTDFFTECAGAIADNRFGPLINMSFNSSIPLARSAGFQDNWRNTKELGFNSLLGNVGIHYLDACMYLLGAEAFDSDALSFRGLRVSKYSKGYDAFVLTIDNKKILPINVFLSYSSITQNSAIAFFEDAMVALVNGKLSISSPALCFSEGRFLPPSENLIVNYGSTKNYFDRSIRASLDFFIRHVVSKSKIDHYEIRSVIASFEIFRNCISGIHCE